MADPTVREYLIGYLLGALEKDEQKLVEASLAADENLRRELGLMSRALAPLDAVYQEHSPPQDLAAKTCEMVDAYREGILSEETAEEPARVELAAALPVSVESILAGSEVKPLSRKTFEPVERSKPFTARRRMHPISSVPRAKVSDWRWQDLVVSGIVVGFVLVTLIPGMLSRREDARVMACQSNLASLGNSMTDYSERNDGFFPPIPTNGKMSVASAFGPILAEAELLPDDRVLLCPGSSLGEKFSGSEDFQVPSTVEIAQIGSPEKLIETQKMMGGSYGYSLGYNENGTYRPTKNLRRSYFAILSDAPVNGDDDSPAGHHGQRGQNVLFEDGHVLFVSQARVAGGRDNLFLNDANRIAAGLHSNDAVIAAGAVSP